MANVVIKYSVMENDNTGRASTNQNKAQGGNSPVKVTLSNYQTYTFGPNESKTLVSPYAEEALAADNRLKEVSRS
jgi:hypothetical protein